ncbi:ATP-binding cassette domain-containing protein [Sporolactobacillus sp. CQH2019]|uniref:ABC transporter ATP-binding protein/permease n=1 Tax=Sporolactobacillus sp. CQH2019 TaxID=3023512 RepID=UPI0023687B95|nr:ABC transporter ATP-binding protein/permease [Sporolactobacillus sp. CQH2019]MDD9146933.1 ATP-binding cassette domain-containing protein [Sporolactobacillus sp. CQH2019]
MLQIREISKSYTTGDFTQIALDKVSLNFRENEFVSILGQSGSGKTTLLNMIGGLDQYDSGDLIINGKSTKKFKDRDWDAYRNNSVGFIFQSYNLIPHLSLLDNVEMSMTLSGVSNREKRRRALDVLEKVGLKDHIHKKPNQLSGGQMQRVAIARALSNDPDIILADEPTGALDTETSEQIMELIKQISRNKLVIMVTHNPDLAQRYSNRIIRISDGKVISDSNPINTAEVSGNYRLKKTSMSFFTALKLSWKNILTKKGRTSLTAFASSIGIIGIALVLALSNGFNQQINSFESGTLSNYPITISQSSASISQPSTSTKKNSSIKYTNKPAVYSYDSSKNTAAHTNKITQSYVDYVKKIQPSLLDAVSFTRSVNMNLLKKSGNKAVPVDTANLNLGSYPDKPAGGNYFSQYYHLLAGNLPKDKTDLVMVVDEYNRLDTSLLKELGINSKDGESISFDKIIGKQFKLILNNEYYKKSGNTYTVNGSPNDLSNLYNSGQAITLRISGIVRIKEDTKTPSLSSGVYYSDQLAQYFIGNASNSEIVKAQKEADYDVLTGSSFSADSGSPSSAGSSGGFGPNMSRSTSATGGSTKVSLTKNEVLASLGSTSIPTSIALYPKDFDAKQKVTDYLDKWNAGRKASDKINYQDLAAMMTKLSGSIMSAITLVLIAFAAISLIVSMIMVGIIIYISVLERTKEIGVLRALGARKRDITRVFNAETFIIGTCSGLMGIGIAYLLEIPANIILYNLTSLKNVAQLNPLHAAALVVISIVLTLIGGLIPAKMAARRDPVEALRSE